MALLPIASDRVQLATAATDAADNWNAGIRYKSDGKARASTSASTQTNQGIPMTEAGAVSIVDATAGLPAGTGYSSGIPVSGGKVCYSTDPVAHYSNGLPFAANGALAATITA